jgi:filamentous hemagglutinin
VAGTAKAGAMLASAGVKMADAGLDVMRTAANLIKADAKGLGGVVNAADVGMEFGKGIMGQGKPFEGFVQTKLPEGTLDLNSIKSNFSTFDHLTPDGVAVSTKTLDTSAVTYQKPSKITYQLNQYVDQMVSFPGDGRGDQIFQNASFTGKQMQLGIPSSASADQMAAIAQSVQYAQSKGISIVVTKVK